MFKHWLIAVVLIFAITSSFAAQICIFNTTMTWDSIGIVYGTSSPLAGVSVFADHSITGGSGSSFATTDGSGHYSMTTGLTAGMYNVTTFAIGYIFGEAAFVNVAAGQTTMGIDFNLQISGGISGKVTDAVSGNPLNGTVLSANLSNGTGTFGWFGTTGSDGSYLIATNLPTGTYNVSIILPPDGHISQKTTANVVAGIETKNVNLQLARSGIISGKVTAPNGTGLFGIAVSVHSSDYAFYGSAKTDLSGNFRIATGLGTGNYMVYASGAGNITAYGGFYTPVSIPITAGQETTDINMELTPVTTPTTPSGTISGRITDTSSNPIRLASVTATRSGDTGFDITDNNGYYTISDLKNGNDYNVSATASGYYDTYYPTLVSVIVGQTTSNINILMTAKPAANFGTITGTVIGASNPIIPEFPNSVMVMLSLALVTTVAVILTLKVRRYTNKDYPPLTSTR